MINLNKIGILLLPLLILNSGFADSLILKDGREIKGEIIRSDSDSILFEYFVTPTIKDQKAFPREEIAKISSVPEDEKAFLLLGSRATPQTILDTSFYDPLIEKKIPEFIKKYPYSRHITELREDLRSLNAERDRVIVGDRRLDGAWITAAQIEADPVQMGARIDFNELKQLAAGDDPIATLKQYELLEKKYPGSRVLPDALELLPPQMDDLQRKLLQAQANYEILTKKRQAWIDSTPADQAKEVKNALENETLLAKASIANALKDGSKFFPIFPNSKDSLDQLQTLLLTEKARFKALHALPMRESLSDTLDASKLLEIGNIKEAQKQVDAAATLWPANAEIATLRQKIETAMQSQKVATPSPAPVQVHSPSPARSPAPAH